MLRHEATRREGEKQQRDTKHHITGTQPSGNKTAHHRQGHKKPQWKPLRDTPMRRACGQKIPGDEATHHQREETQRHKHGQTRTRG